MHQHLIKKGAKLSDKDKAMLAEHARKGHSKKHMASMRMSMLKGHSFKEAHAAAQKKFGK